MRGIYKKRYWGIFAAVLLLIASIVIFGTDDSQCPPRLAHIDSLMETNPQAAYDSLLHIDSLHVYDGDRPMEMRMRLLKAKAQNKLYLPMPSDSAFNEVVSYYDSHGSANDRMLSRYLLGCIYRDRNDGQKAVRYYLEAAEQADTTDRNCDYRMLSRIHGQLSEVLKIGHLPHESLNELHKFILYAEKAGDFTGACLGNESMIYLYYSVGDTTAALKKLVECNRMFMQKGMRREAAGVYPILIYTCLEKGQFMKARRYMDIYEGESGLFDTSGNIIAGREHYYKACGMYCLGTGNIDSAEYYYRKLGSHGYNYESAHGLLDVYSAKNNRDSVSKYTRLSETEMDSILVKKNTNGLNLALSSYNNNKIIKSSQSIRRIIKSISLIFLVAIAAMLVFGGILFRRHKRLIAKMDNSLAETRDAYLESLNSHRQAMSDVDELRHQLKHVKEKHQEDISQLTAEKELFSVSLRKLRSSSSMESLKENSVYRIMKERGGSASRNKNIQEKDWMSMEQLFARHFPQLYSVLVEKKSLSRYELRVCMLLWTGFENYEIANLLNCTAQSVTNAKAGANEKIFSDRSARTLLANMNMASGISADVK